MSTDAKLATGTKIPHAELDKIPTNPITTPPALLSCCTLAAAARGVVTIALDIACGNKLNNDSCPMALAY